MLRKASGTLPWMIAIASIACGGAEIDGARSRTLLSSAQPPDIPLADDAVAESWPALGTWLELEASPGAGDLAPGAAAVAAADWPAAQKALEHGLAALPSDAPLDARVAGLALLGRSAAAAGDRRAAARAYRQVIDAWHGAETARAVVRAARGDVAAGAARLERALLAVGEALFFDAEEKRRSVERLQMPVYSGPPTERAIERFVVDRVSPWIDGKQPLLLEAEASYAKLASLEPEPPPRWVVRAAARVGQMRGRFAAELRAAPLPAEWRRTGSVPGAPGLDWAAARAAYYRAMDRRAAPLIERARSAFQACERLAIDLRYHDAFADHCTAWLETRR